MYGTGTDIEDRKQAGRQAFAKKTSGFVRRSGQASMFEDIVEPSRFEKCSLAHLPKYAPD